MAYNTSGLPGSSSDCDPPGLTEGSHDTFPSNSSSSSVGHTASDASQSIHTLKPGKSSFSVNTSSQQKEQDAEYEEINMTMQQCMQGPDKKKRRIFGLGQERYSGQILPDDYEMRYAPDELGQEMGPNARVWRVYLDEAELNDRDMVEGWKDGIDVLLVFAGLFSAVVTTFVAQTSQKLDQDFAQISASLLTELIAIQRAVAVGAPIEGVPVAELSFSSPPRYTRADTWVNGLWFTSLALSLVTALSAVLIKQWIQHYVSFVSGTPLERARIHQFRYLGLQRWGVRGIIGVLPVLVYAALFLFILGLVVFLQSLKVEIASAVGLIGGIAFVLYLATNGLPLFYPQCPYRTPLIEHINTILFYGSSAYRTLLFILTHRIIPRLLSHYWVSILPFPHERLDNLKGWCGKMLEVKPSAHKRAALKIFETRAAESEQDKMTHDIIVWMLTLSSNPSVRPIALQATSGLRVGYSRMAELFGEDSLVRNELIQELDRQRTIANEFGNEPALLIDSPHFYSAERIVRASMFVSESYWDLRPIWEPADWEDFDQATSDLGVSTAFLQVLATYRGHSIQSHHYPAPLQILSPLSSLVNTAKDSSAAWQAWSYGLKKTLTRYTIPISTVHSCFKPLFQALVTCDTSLKTFDALLPFLCQALPQDIVEEYYGSPLGHFCVSPETLKIEQNKLVILLLRGVIVEWDSDHRYRAEVEDLIMGTCSLMIDAILYVAHHDGVNGTVQPQLTVVLDRLVCHEGFVHSHWDRSTYEWLIFAYIRAYVQSPLPGPNVFSSYESVHSILGKTDCVHGLLTVLFGKHSYWGIYPYLSDVASYIVRILEGLPVNGPTIKNVFDAFQDLSLVQAYLTGDTFSKFSNQWPSHMQPLVRWMLDYIIDHSGTLESHPSIDAFSSNLLERHGFLTFICSGFLLDTSRPVGYEVVLDEGSTILRRLAKNHVNKPGAPDVWRRFFSWIQVWSSWIRDSEERLSPWTRAEFQKYERMADLVDELANTLKLDDPIPRVPRFEEDYIIRFLRAKECPLGTPQPMTQISNVSGHEPHSKLSVFRKLIPWKSHLGATGTDGVDLESNPN